MDSWYLTLTFCKLSLGSFPSSWNSLPTLFQTLPDEEGWSSIYRRESGLESFFQSWKLLKFIMCKNSWSLGELSLQKVRNLYFFFFLSPSSTLPSRIKWETRPTIHHYSCLLIWFFFFFTLSGFTYFFFFFFYWINTREQFTKI